MIGVIRALLCIDETGNYPPETDEAALRWLYERAQQHYEHDLDLFINRMTFFLTISVALAGVNLTEYSQKWFREDWLIGSGMGLSVLWLLLGLSAFLWVYRWRCTLLHYSDRLELLVDKRQTPARLAFRLWDASGAVPSGHTRVFVWFRPTVVTLCIPALFLVYWLVALVVALAS